jgi:hypothetical protein
MTTKKKDLEHNIDLCSKKLDRAEKLIGGLGGEKDRWTQAADTLSDKYVYVREYSPGDLTISKRTGTSNRIEIQFRTFNHLSRPDSFAKLFETLCLCLAQGNEYLGQI